MNRAVVYARVSGDDRGKDGRNLAGQLAMGREYVTRNGYTLVAELAEDDRGASGASFELEKLKSILQMARNHEFDVLVVREIDRLSRKLAKQLIVEMELKRHGVRIEYVLGEYPDTPEGNMLKHVRATLAEFEREKIVERSVRGRRLKIQAGHVTICGRAPFGYAPAVIDGKNTLAIIESEAMVVRQIYDWYINQKMTFFKIAQKLTQLGVPTASDSPERKTVRAKRRAYGVWCPTSVQQILSNKVYMGKWQYGKRNNKKTGHWEDNPDYHLLTVPVPAIVSESIWKLTEEQRKQNKQRAPRRTKYEYLIGRRVRCGICNCHAHATTFVSAGTRRHYYRCPSSYASKTATQCTCSLPTFRGDILDALVWSKIQTILSDPEVLRMGIQQQQEQIELDNSPLRERLRVVDDLLADNRAQLARLLDLYLRGEFAMDVLMDRKKRLETVIYSLEHERVGLASTLEAKRLSPEDIQVIQDYSAQVADGLLDGSESFETRRQVIDALDTEVKLTLENGQQVVYIQLCFGRPTRVIVPNPAEFHLTTTEIVL